MKILRNVATAFGLMILASQGQAATIGFANIAGGDTSGDSLVGRFSLELTDVSTRFTQKVQIKIKSAAANASYFIGSIFIDDEPGNRLSGESSAYKDSLSYRTEFKYKTSGGFAQGNLINFGATARYMMDGGSSAGVQPGDYATFQFGGTYAQVLAGLQSGALRFGLHVQGINLPGCEDGSDSFVSYVPPVLPPIPTVPLPASGLMFLGALGGLVGLRRRKS